MSQLDMAKQEFFKFRQWCRQRGLTIKGFASHYQFARASVYNAFSDRGGPLVRQRLANACGLTLFGYPPEPVEEINENDPSAGKRLSERARKSRVGIPFCIQGSSPGEKAAGYVGRDGRGVILPAGVELEFTTLKEAHDAADELTPAIATRRGRTISLTSPVQAVFETNNPKGVSKAQMRKLSASSRE